MVGESKMIGMAVELLTNLYQAFMFTTFLYLYFEKPESKLNRRLAYWGYVTILFVFCSFFTLTGLHTGIYYLDSLLCISTLISYCVLFLKGKIYMRIIIPVFAFGINAFVSYTTSYLLVFFTGISAEEFFTVSTYSRYTILVTVNVVTALLLWLVLKLKPSNIQLLGIFEVIAFALIPILCTVILYCCMFIYQSADFNDNVLAYLLICCLCMIIIAVLIYLLLLRLSKANTAKTQLLLAAQRSELYEKSIIASNMQIEKIVSEKHDIKNKISTLEKLIENGSYDDAVNLCRETTDSLKSAYSPIYSDNPILNAIVNVELEKATNSKIDFSVDIANTLKFLSSADTVSLIGNLCDNAIEYLNRSDFEKKQIILKIRTHLSFCIITCKNTTDGNVFKENPCLTSTKNDNTNHGKGLSILRKMVKEYDGDLVIKEHDDSISISAILRMP